MELILSTLAATVLGVLTGLGVGGGSLLLLYLTLAVRMEAAAARTISLLFFFPAAALSALRARKQVSFQGILPAILGGCAGALLFSFLGKALDPGYFRKALGLFLLILGIRELRLSHKIS